MFWRGLQKNCCIYFKKLTFTLFLLLESWVDLCFHLFLFLDTLPQVAVVAGPLSSHGFVGMDEVDSFFLRFASP
jgi:hypothetical protein